MFATRGFRPAQQLSQQIRRYATEPTKAAGGSNALLYGAVGAAGAGGAYYYFNRSSVTTQQQGKGAAINAGENAADKKSPAVKAFTGGDQGFISLALDSVEDVNHNTKKLRFKFDDPEKVSGLSVASAILTKFKKDDMEKPVVRPYTPTSDEDEAGYFDLIVKRYPNGPMSEYLHAMKPGEKLDMKGPLPKYPWSTNKHNHIALIAGGTGITPMYQLCRAIFKNPEDNTKVTLVFGNVSEKDILLKKEFDQLEKDFPDRFRAFHVLDNPPPKWEHGKGHITKDLLKSVIPGPKGENVKVFVCGPPGLYKAISGTKKSPSDQGELAGYLQELGYTKEQVYKF